MTDDAETEREERWWAAWFQADYSWEGLAKHEIQGGGVHSEKTLQDYWRRDPATGQERTDAALKAAGELVEFDGRWWHLVHLPPWDLIGAIDTWKADPEHRDWRRTDTLVADRLASAQETAGAFAGGRGWIPKGADGRARLDGGVIGSALNWSALGTNLFHLSCVRAWIGMIAHNGGQFGLGTDFSHAAFSGEAIFVGAIFSGEANFSGAIFLQQANFPTATFSGDADFFGAAFFYNASFLTATFSGGADFSCASFPSDAKFNSAIFSGAASFKRATFSRDAHFDRAVFSGDTRFNHATFSGAASFDGAAFSRDTHFNHAIFSGAVSFKGATFFRDAHFDRAVFSGDAHFDLATFSRDAGFESEVLSGDTRFNHAIFSGAVSFKGATFSRDAHFDSATFERGLWFSAPGGPDGGFGFGPKMRASFRSAVFKEAVQFHSTIAEPERSFAGAFYAARFLDTADFSNAVAPGQAGRLAAAFEETQFEKALILTDGSDRQARSYVHDITLPAILGANDGKRDSRLRQFEAGCRKIKIAMGKERDELREQRYYRFQLRARQLRSDIDPWEKAFGLFYGLASDFGSDLWRPFAGLIGLTVLAGLGYSAWAAWLNVSGPGGVWEGQGMALTAVFKPFSALGDAGVTKVARTSFTATLMAVNPAVAMGVRLVTTLQSLLSGVLIFLFGLAVKRRFQIS